MTERTPVPDEPGAGSRTSAAPSARAQVSDVRANGARVAVALGPRTPAPREQSDGQPTTNTERDATRRNGRPNGAHRNGTQVPSPTPPNGRQNGTPPNGKATSAPTTTGGTSATGDTSNGDVSANGRGSANGHTSADGVVSANGHVSVDGGTSANGKRVDGGVRGRAAGGDGASASDSHGTTVTNGRPVAGGGAGSDGASGEGAGAGHVGDEGGAVVNGAAQHAVTNGHPGTFGFGDTAGVLPGDQRTFDDVEAGIVALWRRFGERREQRLRDRLVLHYAPLVKYVAGRVGTGLPAHVEVADLIQSGIFGLVDAIEKFEPERGLKFETYAMQRIRGAILDDLRAQDWVPRSVRGRAREVERALERLGAQLRRTPTDAELADELGLSLHELRDVYAQLQLTSVVALDELAAAGRGSTPLADILEDQEALDPVALLVDQDNRRQLAQAIAHLAERDRVVVTLYYFENLTLAEIGRVLGVTESRVCQLHTRAVLRLRAKLLEKTEV
jgi:RNA polymerase sigma factor FliA